MERKLATVLFVDVVDSTGLVATHDPEVVRRRMTRFFEHVSRCIETHGGTVEKFAGDAVMAAFGVPRSHEDDAERALRAALAMSDALDELGLEARIGVEAGEVVTDDGDSTFATGEAVNTAARLQQTAAPGEILVGPGAHGLAHGAIEWEDAGSRTLRGRPDPLQVWRAVGAREGGRPLSSLSAPLIGRDTELELLENTFERAVRGGRAHLFTIYGDPGVGKSRLAREFVAGLEGATVLSGRCLPYGEGITYWPLAEMVKSAAGIADDEPSDEAHEKLLACCEDEAVADLLGLAAGVLETVQGERSQQEIAWATTEWASTLARAQPLVLVFEDIHWAEEPLLELVEHLAARVRDAPLLLLCLARPELLDFRPGWGGGRLRATAIELEPLGEGESEELVDALLEEAPLSPSLRAALLETTEGNPLFVEETIRMLAEGNGSGAMRLPDTLQTLIAARIDRLPAAARIVLRRAAVIGRTFWAGAIERLSPEVSELGDALEDLVLRDLVQRESRSTIRGEHAYRFKHVLIRDVAYSGLPKSARADLHERFAGWLAERAGEELLEIRAYHLDQAAGLLAELDGPVPEALRHEAAEALETAGRRALAREANRSARTLLTRAVDLQPTLARRYEAARAAWRLKDLPAVATEMALVCDAAQAAHDQRIEGRALTALAEVALEREADVPRARVLASQALAVLEQNDDEGRYDALNVLGTISWWEGELTSVERYAREKLEIARRAGRKDMESGALTELVGVYRSRLEDERAEPLVARAIELAEESGSLVARAWVARIEGERHSRAGELDDAEEGFAVARDLFAEAGAATDTARMLNWLGFVRWRKGDLPGAEKLLREAVRTLTPLEDRGTLVETQRTLAQILLAQGKLEEAERYALQSRETVGSRDMGSRATTRVALGLVRAAQGRDAEAERLLREALEIVDATDFRWAEREPLDALAGFLRSRGREDEAGSYEARLAELAPSAAPIA